jgi:lipopolysaccharide biosynthesis glycosyltransferase
MPVNRLASKERVDPMANESIVVVCAADNRYAMPLTVVARSALENLDRDRKMILFVIDGGITSANKRKILRSLDLSRCQVQFIPKPASWIESIEDTLSYLKKESPAELKHVVTSVATYYRLFIPELLPDWLDRVIYLDCDLVVKNDLSELWEADFQNNYVLAVQDLWEPYVSTGLPNYKKLGIPAECKYFNAGVLLVNLKKWRTDGITQKTVEYLKHNKECIRAHDQGVLNAMFAKQWGELDCRWNLTPAIVDLFASWQNSPFPEDVYNRLIRNPYIIHFATDRKPWNSRHTPFKEAFFDYVDMTAWSGWRLTFWRRFQLRFAREVSKVIKRVF